jgi:hypothetical protein
MGNEHQITSKDFLHFINTNVVTYAEHKKGLSIKKLLVDMIGNYYIYYCGNIILKTSNVIVALNEYNNIKLI